METYVLTLCLIGGSLVFLAIVKLLVQAWARTMYTWILQNPATACDIDAFVNVERNPVNAVKVVLMHQIQLGRRVASMEPVPLAVADSPHVEGLKLAKRAGGDGSGGMNLNQWMMQLQQQNVKKPPIVVASLRMGFGHHRLAYAVSSWAIQTGHPTIFHDFLSIDSAESELVQTTDELYSKFSRMASEMGGAVEKVWGSAMKQGDANALRMASITAAHLQPLLTAYAKDTPVITTHQLVALTAAAAGFTNVVNLVVDNWAQWFLTVPRTLNIVQGPVNYQSFLRMGIRPDEVQWAGHWCPADLVQNIEEDCHRRIDRARSGRPVRVLIPVGGAGAQRKFILNFIRELSVLVKENKVQLFLNAGDHKHMKTAFLQMLDACGLEFETVSNTQGVREFQRHLLNAKNEPRRNVTLFAFEDYFPAVATTDILCRVTDILSCKPSELAFYCVPKLHIRRVGDHEAASAKRSSELGDGTEEAREIVDALEYMDLFLSNPDFLVSMNEAIVNNNKIGIYDGCRKAVQLSLERAKK